MKTKYPRTYNFPWSEGASNDDKILKDTKNFIGKEVVVTLKLDGENTTMARDYIHARSLDSVDHPSRHWVKGLWAKIQYNIPENWRICGENVFAVHSIPLENLDSYFYVFNIWNEKNECLSWDETIEWCKLFELECVEVLYRGVYDENLIKNIKLDYTKQEGYVVMLVDSFNYKDFSKCVAKAIRAGHVKTDEHWMLKAIIPNKLKIVSKI